MAETHAVCIVGGEFCRRARCANDRNEQGDRQRHRTHQRPQPPIQQGTSGVDYQRDYRDCQRRKCVVRWINIGNNNQYLTVMYGIQDSTTANFSALIRSGGKYIIPKFQRDYSWEIEQWDDLWHDIENIYAEKTQHYMGYLVLQVNDSKNCLIIDGQQRFITITMIILAAIKSIQKLINKGEEVQENSQRVQTLKDTYIGNVDPVSLEYDNILVLNRNNDGYYKEYIVKLGELKYRNTSYTEKLMKKCFEWYEKQLVNKYKTGKEYAELITYIVDNLYFTTIRVTDEMNAFKVFETLNARGVKLSSADLLKNYLFSLVDNTSQHPDRILILERKWSDLTKNIQAERLPDFIRYYWNSKHKTVRANDLFKAIRDSIKKDVEVFALVTEMLGYSDVYMALRDANDELWHGNREISENIGLLRDFNMRQPFSLLMAAYKHLDISMFERLLKDIVVVGFRYNVICGKNPNDIERIYNNIATQISNSGTYSKSQLREVYVDDNEFVNSFSTKSFVDNSRNNKIVKYILGKYERFKGGTRDISSNSETDTIEHILPQNPGEEWGENNYDFDSLIYRLGNICLLEKNYNRGVENRSYEEKKVVYTRSNFETTKSIPEHYAEWNGESINKRQQYMSDCAKSIWKIDFTQ